jgi:hypothetical protein
MTVRTNMAGAGMPGQQSRAVTGIITVAAVATGTTQATAYALQTDITQFGTVAASSGAILPGSGLITVSEGDIYEVFNGGANALAVYPYTGFAINSLAVNTALSVPAGKSATFRYLGLVNSVGTWYANLSA